MWKNLFVLLKITTCFLVFFILLSINGYADEIRSPFLRRDVLELEGNYSFPSAFSFSSTAGGYYKKDFDVKASNTWFVSANYFVTKKFTVGLKAISSKSKGTESETYKKTKFDSQKRGYGLQIQYYFAGKLTKREKVTGSFCPYIGVSYLRESEYFKKNTEYRDIGYSYYTETWNGHSTGFFGGIVYLMSNNIALTAAYNYQMYGFNKSPSWPPRNADLKYNIGSITAGLKIYL